MMYAMISQIGGCDYSIGCGLKVVTLKAVTITEARQEVQEWFDRAEEDAIDRIVIIEGRKIADWDAQEAAQ